MSIKFKLAIPTLLGLILILFFIEFGWKPLKIDREKDRFERHAIELLKVAETGISQPLLIRDFGTLFSNLEQLQKMNTVRWKNLTLFDKDQRQIYPLIESVNDSPSMDVIPIEYDLVIEDRAIGSISLNMEWESEKAAIVSQIDNVRNMIIAIMFLIVLITSISQYRVIYRPIKKLVHATRKVQKGNLHPELPEITADEFGDLTSAFDDMLVELSFQKSALDAHAIVSSTDQNGIITQVNNRYTEVSKYSNQELVGQTHAVVNSAVHPEAFFENLWHTILKGKRWSGEICNRKKNGELYWVNTTILPFLDAVGVPNRFICIQTDITLQKNEVLKRREVEASLLKERQRLDYILQGTNVGTWEWEVQSGITYYNEQWAAMVGYTLKELSPTTISIMEKYAHPEDFKKSRDLIEKHFDRATDYYECELRMRHKDGHWVWVLDRGRVSSWGTDGKPILMCGTYQDITDRKEAEEAIRHLATHDRLTDLPNLTVVEDRVHVALKQARRNNSIAALLFVDLDGFKAVNDSAGHRIGNLVLVESARRLLKCVRESDTVARIGGDEFLILLQNLNDETVAGDVALKVVKLLRQPINIEGLEVQVGASVGISVYPIHGKDFETLLSVADDAMYSSKKAGKNGYTFA